MRLKRLKQVLNREIPEFFFWKINRTTKLFEEFLSKCSLKFQKKIFYNFKPAIDYRLKLLKTMMAKSRKTFSQISHLHYFKNHIFFRNYQNCSLCTKTKKYDEKLWNFSTEIVAIINLKFQKWKHIESFFFIKIYLFYARKYGQTYNLNESGWRL